MSPDQAPWFGAIPPPDRASASRHVLLFKGIGHLTFARADFYAQVPPWLPRDGDFVVIASGVVEIALGAALIVLHRRPVPLGWITAAFFVLVFPGNIPQYLTHTDGFGLDSDRDRAVRLLFQPVLVVWALWSTGGWAAWHRRALVEEDPHVRA